MTLKKMLRLHAVLAILYAIGLVLLPNMIIGLLSDKSLGDVGADITRLFGAALVLVALIAWFASRMSDLKAQRNISFCLLVNTTLGAIITIIGQFTGTWGVLGWSNIISYLIFVIGYGYFLFLKSE